MKTYIYFIQAGYTGPIKIGYARNVEKRRDTMQTGNHMELKLLAKLGPYSDTQARHFERTLHKKFKRKHIRGEWFDKSINLQSVAELRVPDDPLPCEVMA